MKKIIYSMGCIKIGVLCLLALSCFNCNGNSGNKSNAQKKVVPGNQILLKPPSSFTDTLIINLPSAIFYNPDSLQLQKIKSINKKMIFESMTHDCFYQMRNARTVLKKNWPRIGIIETHKAQFLLFIKRDKRKICIDLNKKNDICGVFIFDREKDPELIDMMNIDTELNFYFKR